jgi:hypothetical protein
MYLIKQLIGALANPLLIAFLIGALAGMYRVLGRRRIAVWCSLVALGAAYFGSIGLVRMMERAGAHPIPAPTGQLVRRSALADLGAWFPSSRGLRKTERALHEYLGLTALAVGLG